MTMEMLFDNTYDYIYDYIRGIIDANGTICVYNGNRPKIQLTSGSYRFSTKLVEVLSNLFPNTHCSVHKKKDTVYNIYVGVDMTEKLLIACYKDVDKTIVLDRKLEKANAALSRIA